MSVRITYFVHGTTTDNEKKLSSGWADDELSELGIQQAKELGQLTKHLNFDVVFTSDLKRAIESAKLAWGDKYKIITDPRLRECNYGELNAKPSETVEPIQEKSITTPMPGGESYEMVKDRIQSFLNDIRKDYDGKHIAIVGHKAPQLALDVLLKGETWEEAFANDWRKIKKWQPGWEYILKSHKPILPEKTSDKISFANLICTIIFSIIGLIFVCIQTSVNNRLAGMEEISKTPLLTLKLDELKLQNDNNLSGKITFQNKGEVPIFNIKPSYRMINENSIFKLLDRPVGDYVGNSNFKSIIIPPDDEKDATFLFSNDTSNNTSLITQNTDINLYIKTEYERWPDGQRQCLLYEYSLSKKDLMVYPVSASGCDL